MGQRLASSMPMHPLPALMNFGVPVALCSDDPAVFGNMGLTYDYFQASVHVSGRSVKIYLTEWVLGACFK